MLVNLAQLQKKYIFMIKVDNSAMVKINTKARDLSAKFLNV